MFESSVRTPHITALSSGQKKALYRNFLQSELSYLALCIEHTKCYYRNQGYEVKQLLQTTDYLRKVGMVTWIQQSRCALNNLGTSDWTLLMRTIGFTNPASVSQSGRKTRERGKRILGTWASLRWFVGGFEFEREREEKGTNVREGEREHLRQNAMTTTSKQGQLHTRPRQLANRVAPKPCKRPQEDKQPEPDKDGPC